MYLSYLCLTHLATEKRVVDFCKLLVIQRDSHSATRLCLAAKSNSQRSVWILLWLGQLSNPNEKRAPEQQIHVPGMQESCDKGFVEATSN